MPGANDDAKILRSERVSFEKRALPRVSPDVVWTTVADGAVLFSASRELYYGVNEVATFVWEQLPAASRTLEELCAAVQAKFPDARPEQVRTDVLELLEDMARYGLLESAVES